MEMQYDTGLVFSQEFFNIELIDDVKTVYDKVAGAAVTAIEKHLVDWTEGKLNGVKQDDSCATHYPRRRPSDGLFSFERDSALNIYNHIRGQARPYPGAFFEYDCNGNVKKVYVWKARLGADPADGEVAFECKEGSIILQRVQEDGRPEMWAKDYFES